MGTFNSGSKGGALTLIPVVKSGNGAGTCGTWELVK